MKTRALLIAMTGVLISLFACYREYSFEGGKSVDVIRDTLPRDYPYATGYCNDAGASLGVVIADTVDYLPDTAQPLPSSILLDMPVPGDQSSQRSCAAWATVYGAGSYYVHTILGKAYSDTGNLSPKFIYNQITKGNCTCTSILDHLYLMKMEGACSLSTMPYDPGECSLQPDSIQKSDAETYKIKGWAKVNLHNLKCIRKAIQDKHPVIFAISVDPGFEALSAPYVWKERSGAVGGPHALVITGYDDAKHAFRFMNSWSTAWADGGFAWVDYDFFFANVFEGGYIIL